MFIIFIYLYFYIVVFLYSHIYTFIYLYSVYLFLYTSTYSKIMFIPFLVRRGLRYQVVRGHSAASASAPLYFVFRIPYFVLRISRIVFRTS